MSPTTLAEALHDHFRKRLRHCEGTHLVGLGDCQWAAAALLALPPDQRAALAAELLDAETLATVIAGQDLYHGRRGTTPAGKGTAGAILAALRGLT